MKRTGRRMRRLALVLFGLVAVSGSICYWVRLGGMTLRPERTTMWTNGAQWWAGIRGRMLTQHRPGLQVALLDQATGTLSAVWDLRGEADALAESLGKVPPGKLCVVTLLEPGFTDEQLQQLAELLSGAGWSGDLSSANEGAAVFVFARDKDGTGLTTIASRLSQDQEALVTLPEGFTAGDGPPLARPFTIHVRPYD